MLRGRLTYLAVRGKRVVTGIGYLILVIGLFIFFPSQSFAQEAVKLTVTATVPLSPLWKQAILQNSGIQFDSQSFFLNVPVKMTITSKGYNNQSLPDQLVRIGIFANDRQIVNDILTTNNNGIIGYAFVPTQYGDYHITAENISYQTPLLFAQKKLDILSPADYSFFHSILNFLPKF